MKLSLNETKLIGLTMELDLKTREFKKLCNKLEKYKKVNIDENDERLLKLKEDFTKNKQEIVKINEELNKLKNVK